MPLRLKDDSYLLDEAMLDEVQEIAKYGYKAVREDKFAWREAKDAEGLSNEEKQALLAGKMLVREQKPHICYNFIMTMDDLHNLSAEQFVKNINCTPSDLNADTAHELLFKATQRFRSIETFR